MPQNQTKPNHFRMKFIFGIFLVYNFKLFVYKNVEESCFGALSVQRYFLVNGISNFVDYLMPHPSL